MAYDINKILAEYGDDDFGFSAVSEEDYNAVINEKADTVDEYSARLKEVEKLVLPFFTKLLKTADNLETRNNLCISIVNCSPTNTTKRYHGKGCSNH